MDEETEYAIDQIGAELEGLRGMVSDLENRVMTLENDRDVLEGHIDQLMRQGD